VSAQGPTFDCAKARGEVEKLICSDPSLAALDRKLASVFQSAMARARDGLDRQLKTEQRGWIQGRNECWKARDKTWITATWTVNTVKDCVDARYRMRTAELQALWRLVPSRTVSFVCENNPANVTVADFFATDPATIRLERGDRTATLWLVGSASNGLYEGQNVSLVLKGDDLRLSWLDTNAGRTDELRCKRQ
jgi:uncharacterized protein YecT (DUF1311 family)